MTNIVGNAYYVKITRTRGATRAMSIMWINLLNAIQLSFNTASTQPITQSVEMELSEGYSQVLKLV